ncbi:SMP-30/gluconolactonase/LRE family protein [Paenibacillus contaminans]|uniref:Regucalcin n=1 Tax=Paenibacillus contaminans TaxID=450362 RepID=A0A329MQR0_9BACL|nr:SMP-30/gluconolactonase/LRE family protein [Paenibacillus contaminans]RAV21626.1 SMP-30/gluconolactonase/LRE family protein [Paenibacillus contaminans]
MNQLELVINARAELGEGPSWDSTLQRLYWVDLSKGRLHVFDPAAGTDREIAFDQAAGAVVPRRSGGVALALEHGFYTMDEKLEVLTQLADPESHLPGNRFNDGKCDAAGRFWAGTMSANGVRHAGTLYRLDPDGNVAPVISGVSISNGIGWSPDNGRMYYIDSAAREVMSYDYCLDTGELSGGRVCVSFPEAEGLPDGMAVDAEGMIWIAQWDGCKVSRLNPDTGKLLDVIPVPARFVTSCAFGGASLDELYITTARGGLSDEELAEYPHAGGVFRLKTNVRGLPTFAYGG